MADHIRRILRPGQGKGGGGESSGGIYGVRLTGRTGAQPYSLSPPPLDPRRRAALSSTHVFWESREDSSSRSAAGNTMMAGSAPSAIKMRNCKRNWVWPNHESMISAAK